MSVRNRQLLLLIVALIVMVAMGVLLFLNAMPPAQGSRAPVPPQNTAGPADPPGGSVSPDEGGESGSEPSASSVASAPPPAPTEPAPTGQHEGPVRKPTGGPLKEKDAAEIKALINDVVPAWSQADFAANGTRPGDGRAARDLTRAWVASWRDEDRVSSAFVEASSNRFTEIWGGAIQMTASVTGARIISAELVDNYGSESLWRVEVERTVKAPNIEQSERITWHFMIINDADGPLLDQFFLPSDMSTGKDNHG